MPCRPFRPRALARLGDPRLEDEKLCPAFALRLVRGVKNGPSPDWMQRRLLSIGLRPINALVDITNYMTFDRGRPLHVFDAKKVNGNLTVRRAKDGEEVLALDGRTYKLDPATWSSPTKRRRVHCRHHGRRAFGLRRDHHGRADRSALWDPHNIAQSGRRSGIITDARYRFERGVDPAFTVPGLDLATKLVIDLCGGEASEAVVPARCRKTSSSSNSPGPRFRACPVSTCNRRSRNDPEEARLRIQAPASASASRHRPGVRTSTARPISSRSHPHRRRRPHRTQAAAAHGRHGGEADPDPDPEAHPACPRSLAVRGLVEAVTWSFIAKSEAELFGGGDALALANPIAADLSDMRPSPAAGP